MSLPIVILLMLRGGSGSGGGGGGGASFPVTFEGDQITYLGMPILVAEPS